MKLVLLGKTTDETLHPSWSCWELEAGHSLPHHNGHIFSVPLGCTVQSVGL